MNSKLRPVYWTFGLLFSAFVLMSYNDNPPPFRTQAPPSSSSTCASGSCHSNGSGFTGSISFSGLPTDIMPNMTYTISVKVTNPDGNAAKAGFQLEIIDESEVSVGILSNPSSGSGIETNGGRNFFEHRGGQFFNVGNEANWSVTWTAPANISGSTVQLWGVGNISNNNGGASGDDIVFNMQSFNFAAVTPLNASITNSTNVSCNGGSNGSATAAATGGNSPYTYRWSNNAGTTATVNNLSAGTYTVTVTDATMMTATASVTISQPTDLTLAITSLTNIDCNTMSGNVSVQANGGTPGYTYLWSNGSMSSFNNGLAAGTYTITVTDMNTCIETLNATISDTSVDPIADGGPDQTINCNNPQTVLNGFNSSTGPNFSYMWEQTAGGNIVSGGTTLFPTVDSEGIYILTVTNNSNACRAQSQVIVTADFDQPTASIATPGLLSCDGTMLLNASASSSNGAVSFQWSTSDGIIENGENTATPTISAAGTYEVIVSDNSSDCEATASVTVQSSDAPIAIATGETVINCFNPEIVLDGTGSSQGANISYDWTTSNGNIVSGENTLNPTIDAAGLYTLTVLNENTNCSSSDNITVTSNMTTPTANGGPDLNLVCNATFIELQAEADMSGQAVTYLWSTQDGNILAGFNTLTPSVNTEGTYEFTVTNNNSGCSSSDFVIVGDGTTPPFVDAGPDQILGCNGNTVTLDGTNSETGNNFIYSWSTSNGNIVSGEDTATPVVDAPGTYSLAIFNTSTGCANDDAVVVTESNGFDAQVISQGNVSCFGLMDGFATIDIDNGTPPFTYDWSNGGTMSTENTLGAGTYTVTIMDNTGCSNQLNITITQPDTLIVNASATPETAGGANNGRLMAIPNGGTTPYSFLWSNGAMTAFVNNVAPGTYTVTVTDNNDCESSQTVVVNAANCSIALVSIQANEVSCNGGLDGSATVIVNGGTTPYTYQWSSGGTEMTETGLSAGSYNVIVNDNNSCALEANVTITEPDILVLSLENSSDVSCANALDGMATVLATGGTAPYQYRWLSTGDTDNMEDNLAAGTHTVSVMDANGCDTTIDVLIEAPNALEFEIEATNETNTGEADGTATINVQGGTSPYTYLWDDANAQTTATATGLGVGTYNVTVTDANTCTITATIEIMTTVDDILIGITNVEHVSCHGFSDGSASINVSGGVPPYRYNWSNGATEANISNLPAGTYTLTVTDAAENADILQITVTEPAAVTTQIQVTHETSLGANDGTATIFIFGGTGIYGGATDGQIVMEDLAPSDYQVTITDSNNCNAIASFTINSFSCGNIAATATATDASCPDVADGTATVEVTDGTGPYTYLWSNGGTESSILELTTGTYTVTVTDAGNCETIAMVTVESNDLINPTIITQNIIVNLDENGTAIIDPAQVNNASFDNCSMVGLSLDITDFDCNDLGGNEVVLTGTDSSNNSASSTATVTIVDDIPPTITCPDNITVEGACTVAVEYDLPTAEDNCGMASVEVIVGLDSGASFPAGITTQILEATDIAGNTATCSFEVNVIGDVLSPDIVVNEPSCTEFTDGTIAVNVNGGTPPYTIDWMGLDPTEVGAGNYPISITDANGCAVNVNILVGEPSPIQISEPSITDATDGQSNGEINASVSGGSGNYTFEWLMNGVVVSTDLNLINAPAGVYILRVTDNNNCTVASDEITIDNLVGINELEKIEHLVVLPNPNTGHFVLSLGLYETQTVQVGVFDFTGKELIRLAPERLLSKNFPLDLTNMAGGVYWLKVLVDGELVVRKVVVQ